MPAPRALSRLHPPLPRRLTVARALALILAVTALGSGCATLPYAAQPSPPARTATLPVAAEWTEITELHVRFAVPADHQDARGVVPKEAFDKTQALLGANDALMNEIADDDNYALLLRGMDDSGPWSLNARVLLDTPVPSDRGLVNAFADLNVADVSVRHVTTPIGPATSVAYRTGASHLGKSVFVDRGDDVLNITYGAPTTAAVDALGTTVVGSLHVTD